MDLSPRAGFPRSYTSLFSTSIKPNYSRVTHRGVKYSNLEAFDSLKRQEERKKTRKNEEEWKRSVEFVPTAGFLGPHVSVNVKSGFSKV